jgi:Tol biopolymer transport system component
LFSTLEFGLSRYISWSPAGDRIAAILFRYAGNERSAAILDTLDLRGRENRRDLPTWQVVGRTLWDTNGRSIFTTAADNREAAIQAQVRQIDLGTNKIQNLTREIAGYQGLSATADRSRFAVTKMESKASIWISARSDFLNGAESSAEVEYKPTLSWLNSDQLVIGSLRNGYPNLWRFDSSDQSRTELTHEDFAEQEAVAVPGSESLIFVSQRSKESKIWRFDPNDNRYQQLTFGPNADYSPAVTPDGRWVYYWSTSSATPFIFRTSTTGGVAEQITKFPAQWPQVSPDGKSILCWMQDPRSSKWGVGVFPARNPPAAKIIPNVGLPVAWSAGNSTITAAITDQHNVSNLWEISLDGRRRRRLTGFNEKIILKFAWSPSGKRIACLRAQSASDVVLFSRNTVR